MLNRIHPMNPLDSRTRIHLEWMFENQPELVRTLLKNNQLRPHLDQKEQQALRLVEKYKAQAGMTEDEAFEAAAAVVLAPADGAAFGDSPPIPLPMKEQESVYRQLET